MGAAMFDVYQNKFYYEPSDWLNMTSIQGAQLTVIELRVSISE